MPIDGYFDVPFGLDGDLTTVPDAVQPDGSVSYEQGFGPDYALPYTNPDAKNVPRDQYNQLLFDITSAIQQYQQHSTAPFITTAMNGGSPYSYSKYDRVLYSGVLYQSIVNSNTDTPPSSKWVIADVAMSNVYTAGTTTGSANAQVVTPVSPTATSFTDGQSVVCVAGFTNSAGMTFGAGGETPVVVKKNSPTGLTNLVGNEVISGNVIAMTKNLAVPCWVLTGGFAFGASAFLGVGNNAAAAGGNLNALTPDAQELRLTLTSGTPVTTGDVTAATTLYFTPYKGNNISLYDGSTYWSNISTSQISIAVPATTNQMYDVFVYNNSGTPTLELLAWTNDTTRATALAYQDGRLVKNGTPTRRYVGSIRTTGSSGQTEDSNAKRYVWNYNNRIRKNMKAQDATATWNYNTNTFREANGGTTNQLDMVIGVSEDIINAKVMGAAANSGGTSPNYQVGIGLASTTVDSSTMNAIGALTGGTGSGGYQEIFAIYDGYPGIGRRTMVWLEKATNDGTTTWLGGTGAAPGIEGNLFG